MADVICIDNPDRQELSTGRWGAVGGGVGRGVMRAVGGGGGSARDSVCMHACFCVYVSVACQCCVYVSVVCKCSVYVSVLCMSVLCVCKCCVYACARVWGVFVQASVLKRMSVSEGLPVSVSALT